MTWRDSCDRRSRPIRRCVDCVLVIVIAVAFSAGAASGQVISIPAFVEMESQWQNLGENAVPLRVEGRVSLCSPALLKFRKCSLSFVADEGVSLPSKVPDSEVVQVSGRLQQHRGKLMFLVTGVKPLRSDLSRFRADRLELNDRDLKGWYALAGSVHQRGEFYEDEELIAFGREILGRALRIELSLLKKDDPQAIRQLAEKSRKLGLGDRAHLELIHRALWVERQTELDSTKLLGLIRRDLPGSQTRLNPPQPKLAEGYLQNPYVVYEQATDSDRRKLERIFWVDVWLKKLERSADPIGKDGNQIADQIDSLAPEMHDRAEEYRDRWLAYLSSRLDSSTREEVLELAELYRQRNQPDKTQEVLRSWIRTHELKWRKEGPLGLVRLAEEYLELLEDRPTAVLLLRQAYLASGNSPEIGERLKSLGVQVGGSVPAGNQPADSDAPEQVQSPIRVGMNREQVLHVLGKPDRTSRVASSSELTEIWTYGQRGTSRLAIRFTRRLDQARPRSQVAAVTRLPAR